MVQQQQQAPTPSRHFGTLFFLMVLESFSKLLSANLTLSIQDYKNLSSHNHELNTKLQEFSIPIQTLVVQTSRIKKYDDEIKKSLQQVDSLEVIISNIEHVVDELEAYVNEIQWKLVKTE
jgi:hypothetical protein